MDSGRPQPATIELIIDDEYVRSELHSKLGGQPQGGISTPRRFPVILIFTGESGKQHGYGFDGWQSQDLFHYTGEGQRSAGDMRFIRGNRAIRDHVKNDERILLFEQVSERGKSRGTVKLVGEMECVGYHLVPRDSSGISREVIVFELKPLPSRGRDRVIVTERRT